MTTRQTLRPGDPVEVRNHFEGTWCTGFHITDASSCDGGVAYRLRRTDGTPVPGSFSADRLRPATWEPVVEWQIPGPFEDTRPARGITRVGPGPRGYRQH